MKELAKLYPYKGGDIVVLDIETTGTDLSKDLILEVACHYYDKTTLELRDTFLEVINVPEVSLRQMDPWCLKTHKQSGLYQECLESTRSNRAALESTFYKLKSLKGEGKKLTLCGNNVHFDKYFLERDEPRFVEIFDHRLLDLRAFETAARFLNLPLPELYFTNPGHSITHRALEDVEAEAAAMIHLVEHFRSLEDSE